jgi:predicted AAA+ superfamily ATPase
VLVGPRQCGKTTLGQSFQGLYFDLEQEVERLRLDLEWPALSTGRSLVVLDEAQAWPEVFNRLRGAIDADRKRNGRFLLLGSVAPSLMEHVSESLAGRLSVLELAPFVWGELQTKVAKDRLWLCGGYPDGGVLNPKHFPQWQQDYLLLLIQRDLPAWGLPARPQVTQRLARMLAALHGQVWNASQIGQSLGLNYQTVNSYVDYLEGAFLTRRLAPFYGNIRKRLVKSPKLYWRDSGLLHALMNVGNRDVLLSQPWVGASWEGFVIEQILNTLSASGQRFNPFYLRTSDQYELDLVLERGGELWAIEVKLTSTPGVDDIARLDRTADLIAADRRFLVSQTPRTIEGQRTLSCNLPSFLARLDES